MFDFGILAKRAGKLASDNSPAILTAIGVTGSLMTAYLTGKASFKAAELISYEEHDVCEVMPTKQRVELTWKLFVPAVASATLTVAAIVSANHIGTRRAATMASAYAISEKLGAEYKNKVLEHLGKEKEKEIVDSVAQDRVDKDPVSKREVFLVTGRSLCYDTYGGRYFESDVNSINAAVNEVNAQIINENYASLTDFYDRIGLSKTDESDEVGWNTDALLGVDFSTTMSDDNRPCIAISFAVRPGSRYSRMF